jgi:hypothetical protein
MDSANNKPALHSIWKNKTSGNLYVVYDYTNEESTRLDEYPVRISYKRLVDGTKWSRSLSDWHRSYIPEGKELKPCPFCGEMPVIREFPPHEHHFAGLPPHPGSVIIECTSCTSGMIDSTIDEVLARWNRRPE